MLSVNKERRGVTLVELLVVTFVLVIILTVVYGTMISVRSGITDNHKRLTMQNTALWIAEEVTGALEGAVSVSGIDVESVQNGEPVFEADHIRFLTSQYFATQGLEWVEFETDDPESEHGVQVSMRRNNAEKLKSMKVPARLSHDLEGLEALITFRYYASGSAIELKPVADTEDGDQQSAMPGLVEFVIIVSDKDAELADYQLQSAVNVQSF